MNDDAMVFVTEETKEQVGLGNVFDVAQDVPSDTDPDAMATVSVGFERGESREAATIEATASELLEFQTSLFRAALDEKPVVVRQKGGSGSFEGPERGSLAVHPRGVRVTCEGDVVSVRREDVEGFETARTPFDGESGSPVVKIDSAGDGGVVRTSMSFPSFRLMNLFGRYLQANPEAVDGDRSKKRGRTYDVLLVDDDPDDLEMTELILRQRTDRLDVTTATSAAGGIERLGEGSFDCVVSDYDMPGTDGIEFLQELRESDEDIPFILFTGQGSEAVAKQAILSNVTDYVEKGIGKRQYEVLVNRIEKALH
jgi:CheY-like chemotaxis protein